MFVDSFTYIGSLITNDGSSSRDITSRIAKAASAMCRLSNPLFRKHRISIRHMLMRVSNQSIRERTKQPTASSLLRQRRLRWFGHLHRMPSSLPVRRVFDFNPNIHGWKRPRGRPKTDGLIQSSTTSTQLVSTPSMPHRWSMTDPSGRPLFPDCQRSNPSMALKSSKSSRPTQLH